jgi:type IV secretory pathway component VirB8
MNSISKNITQNGDRDNLTRDEEDDLVGMVSMPASELTRLYEEQRLERKRRKRNDRAKKFLSGGALAGAIGIALLEGLALAYLMPLKEVETHVVYQRDDGTWVNTARWEDLPKKVRNDTTVNVVWSYVQHWESWSKGGAGYSWKVVSALSSGPIREMYQKSHDPSNPDSPTQVYGDVMIDVQFVSWEPICPIQKSCLEDGPPAYRIWFDRTEVHPDGKKTPPVRYATTVGISRNEPIPQDRIWQRWTFNAPQIQVTEYLGARRQGITK